MMDLASEIKKIPKVYYARAMDEIAAKSIREDDKIVREKLDELGFELANPFQGRLTRVDRSEELVKNNSSLLQDSDLLLANLSISGYTYVGAVFEIVEAAHLDIPVILVVGGTSLDKRYYFQHCSEFIARSMVEGLDYIERVHTPKGIQGQIGQEKSYYEEVADSYELAHTVQYDLNESEQGLFLAEGDLFRQKTVEYCSGRTVLELGCGIGEWTLPIAQVAKAVVCCDTSERMIRRAEERLRQSEVRATFMHKDILKEDLTEGMADVVVCYHLLSIFPPPFQASVLARMKRWAKEDAVFLFAEVSKPHRFESVGLGPRRLQRRKVGERTYIMYKEFFTSNRLAALLERNGFEVTKRDTDMQWLAFCAAQLPTVNRE